MSLTSMSASGICANITRAITIKGTDNSIPAIPQIYPQMTRPKITVTVFNATEDPIMNGSTTLPQTN